MGFRSEGRIQLERTESGAERWILLEFKIATPEHQQNCPAAVRLCDAVAIDRHRHMPLVHSVITAASTVSQRLG